MKRAIKVVPFPDVSMPSGFPSPAHDYIEKMIDLNEEFVKDPYCTFLVETEGDSMQGAFIPPKAILLVDRSLTAANNDIVVAVYNNEFTVRFFEHNGTVCSLVPANAKYKAVNVTDEMQMQIWGVVTLILIKPKDVKYVRPGRLQ